jgi:membrane-bound lytic murein transglycosylase A
VGPFGTGGVPALAPVAANRYWTRAEIEADGKLRGQELVWLKSRWEAYVVTVQGSARLRLPDGRTYEIGFAGTNGHPYVSPGRQMLADGAITRDQLSLKGLGRYFAEHPRRWTATCG